MVFILKNHTLYLNYAIYTNGVIVLKLTGGYIALSINKYLTFCFN